MVSLNLSSETSSYWEFNFYVYGPNVSFEMERKSVDQQANGKKGIGQQTSNCGGGGGGGGVHRQRLEKVISFHFPAPWTALPARASGSSELVVQFRTTRPAVIVAKFKLVRITFKPINSGQNF